KGTTAEMVDTVTGVLSGKRKPPPADPKGKPGLGPPLKDEGGRMKDEEEAARASGSSFILPPSSFRNGPLFAVIPTVLVGGPLAVLAMLFPALFAGLVLVLRRWAVALTVLSVDSTLYLAQQWFLPRLLASWWGTPAALWLSISAVTLLGILWA